ncbi:hypothetical protein LWP59_36460 [Amycolatopsis acidiphila]|uniref:Lipoprotein n=1 Tax=Amycolatopsis acidiphila TaxID=715473 RepID=A0A557ZXK4_9PSEU|nr:hypothetical protein [Amycolatopsis acidiphila]TVT16749.1 hypothetical protein FNH06_34220 [Amycolatopsis acidiphila]UIJ59467.1 hypothetical protein LWP59_36460 [Amycolatopsis acidiphila]GHG94673.1 hypothetical protein GCM10017788_72680 [Amycolatopsis acidiphila]
MRPGKLGFLAILTGLCVGLAGCGRPPVQQDAIQPGGPGLSQVEVQRQDATTRWANDYCIAVGSLVDGLATMPTVDPSTPRRAVQTSSDLLGSMIGGLDNAVRGLRALPASPVPEGDSVRAGTVTELTGVRTRAAAAKQRLDAASNDPTIDQQTLGEASAPLAEVSKLDLLAGFDAVPDLRTAVAHAPVCQQLTVRTTR